MSPRSTSQQDGSTQTNDNSTERETGNNSSSQRTSKMAASPAECNFNAHGGKYLHKGPDTTT
jgi:hypothetical protein